MPKIDVIRALNQAKTSVFPSNGGVALVVGGTSGIGQHTALKLAQHTRPRKIIVTGRNKQAGDLVIENLHQISRASSSSTTTPDDKKFEHEFVACDVSLMKNVRKFTQEIRNKTDKLNLLVLSAGFLSMNGRDETEEGIDKKLACNFYSRFLLIKELLPLLEKAASDGEEARVLSVLGAGYEGNFFKEDLDLKQNFSLSNAANVATTYNSLMIEEFSRRAPGVSFLHINPGFIHTNIGQQLPWYARLPATLFACIAATSPQDCAEVVTYVLTDPQYKTGWHLINSSGDPLNPSKYNNSRENIDIVWEHAEKLTATTTHDSS